MLCKNKYQNGTLFEGYSDEQAAFLSTQTAKGREYPNGLYAHAMVGLRPCQGTTSISVSPHFPPASLLHLLAALVYLAQIDTIAGAKLNKCL